MSADTVLSPDDFETSVVSSLLPHQPSLSSYRLSWNNIQFLKLQLPPSETPEVDSPHHLICFSSPIKLAETELICAGKTYLVPACHGKNYIGVFPATMPLKARFSEVTEVTHCYLEPKFLELTADESRHAAGVELMVTTPPTYDPLVWEIAASLQNLLVNHPQNSCFYADSMAIALAAHLLQFYSTRQQPLRTYTGGLSQLKLNQAFEYINTHLHTNISLADLAAELDLSQYYLSQLFKQSTGITPYAYLIQQRVERSKQLLKNRDYTILQVSNACGFANPSHFAKCFRRYVGISPQEFRSR